MPIRDEDIEFLLDAMSFHEEQFSPIAESCYSDVKRALNEICVHYLKKQKVSVIPTGSYFFKSNYQIIEPMEFYVVLPVDREQIEVLEKAQDKLIKRKKTKKTKSIKDIYDNLLTNAEVQQTSLTALDVARKIMNEMQKYLGENDSVYFRKNVVFVKFNTVEDLPITAIIHIVYEYENKGVYEFSKMGYISQENTKVLQKNIDLKNQRTNGNYLLMCKLIKMLELELVLTNCSDKYLSRRYLFVENVLYNVPDIFYEGENYKQIFINIINYLKNCDMEKIIIPDGIENHKMFQEAGYYANSEYKSIIKKLVFLHENADKLVENAINDSKAYNENDDENIGNENNNDELDNENSANDENNNTNEEIPEKPVKKLGK